MMKELPPICANIRAIRKERGIKQKTLAAAVGVGAVHISAIERGIIVDPKIGLVQKIAKALDVQVDRLIAV